MASKQFLLFIFLFLSLSAGAQNESINSTKKNQDFELWNTIKISKKIFKKTNLSILQSLRLRENATEFNSTFTDISISYEAIKNFDVSFNSRFIFRDKYSTNNQRIYAIVDYSKKIERISIGIRTRFEKQFEVNEIPSKTWRNRAKVSYNIPKMPLEPFAYFEGFYDISYLKNQFNRTRICLGVNYSINKQSDFSVYYINQNEFNSEDPLKKNILGIEYDYKLKKNKTKKDQPKNKESGHL